MKFMLLIYNDPDLLERLPASEFDATMRGCIEHADDLRAEGHLLDSQQLEEPATAKSLRIRNGRQTVIDGPFAESKEVLGGFNLIEAENIEEAVRIAAEFPWARTGCVEVRPVRDLGMVAQRVGARKAAAREQGARAEPIAAPRG
ncbi:MAG: YciI family protein [Gemmatimonadaceae bacterium]